MIGRVFDVLSWRVPADPGGVLRRRARSLLSQRIDQLFRRAAPPEEGGRFRAAVAALPRSGQRRLLDAPALWGQILQDLDADTGPFLDAVHAEQLRLGQGEPPRYPLWTCTGDLGFEPGSRAPAHRAPRLPGGAVLDASSPHATARIPLVVERFVPYGPAELARVHGRVREAAALLPRLCPAADRLFRAFTRTVVIRDLPEHPGLLSESTEGVLGRTLLCNAHQDGVSPLHLVEALVHEAVHSYLSTVELFGPFIPDRAAAADLSPVSPWTGNRLDAQRLVHASLVWFALAALWRHQTPGLPWTPEEQARREAAARRGLAELPGLLPELSPLLSPEARGLLDRILARGDQER